MLTHSQDIDIIRLNNRTVCFVASRLEEEEVTRIVLVMHENKTKNLLLSKKQSARCRVLASTSLVKVTKAIFFSRSLTAFLEVQHLLCR